MRFLFQTRAYALTLAVGVTLGLGFAGVCLAGAVQSRPEKVYAVAAQTGYAQAAAAPSATSITSESTFHVAVKPMAFNESRVAPTPGALDCLAAAVYYEARGESVAGRAAVRDQDENRAAGWIPPAFPAYQLADGLKSRRERGTAADREIPQPPGRELDGTRGGDDDGCLRPPERQQRHPVPAPVGVAEQ